VRGGECCWREKGNPLPMKGKKDLIKQQEKILLEGFMSVRETVRKRKGLLRIKKVMRKHLGSGGNEKKEGVSADRMGA